MEAMRKPLVAVILLTLLVVAGAIVAFSKGATPAPTSYEYFWGEGCPHCTTVEEFIKNWGKAEQIGLVKKEVWKSTKNANLMEQRAASCGISKEEIGVPMLVTPEGKCISGDQPIIDFLNNLNP